MERGSGERGREHSVGTPDAPAGGRRGGRSGPPPEISVGQSPTEASELQRYLAGSPVLETYWVRLSQGSSWEDAIGAVTASGRGWAVADSAVGDLVAIHPSDGADVWTRLCRLTELVNRRVAGDRPQKRV